MTAAVSPVAPTPDWRLAAVLAALAAGVVPVLLHLVADARVVREDMEDRYPR